MVTFIARGVNGIAKLIYNALPRPEIISYGELGEIFSALDDPDTLRTYRTALRKRIVNPWDVVKKTRIPYERAESNLEKLAELALLRRHELSPGHPNYAITEKVAHVASRYLRL